MARKKAIKPFPVIAIWETMTAVARLAGEVTIEVDHSNPVTLVDAVLDDLFTLGERCADDRESAYVPARHDQLRAMGVFK